MTTTQPTAHADNDCSCSTDHDTYHDGNGNEIPADDVTIITHPVNAPEFKQPGIAIYTRNNTIHISGITPDGTTLDDDVMLRNDDLDTIEHITDALKTNADP